MPFVVIAASSAIPVLGITYDLTTLVWAEVENDDETIFSISQHTAFKRAFDFAQVGPPARPSMPAAVCRRCLSASGKQLHVAAQLFILFGSRFGAPDA